MPGSKTTFSESTPRPSSTRKGQHYRSASQHFSAVGPLTLAVHLAFAASAITLSGWTQVAKAQQTVGPASQSQGENVHLFDISAGPLSKVLTQFSTEAGIFLVGATELAQGMSSPGVQGEFSVTAALSQLLEGTGLQAQPHSKGQYVLKEAGGATTLPPVKVSADGVRSDGLPEVYAGGQVARGGRLGMLGNTDVMDAPFSVTSYTSELIENQQARSLVNIVDDDPSVQVAARGRGTNVSGGDVLFIRGLVVRNQDVSLNGLYGVMPRNTIAMEAVERVEILKGPNALLNGTSPWGSVGGGINILPKRAADIPLTRIKGLYRSDAQLGAHIDVSRRFGEENRFGIRFNGVYMDGDTSVQDQENTLGVASVALDYRGERIRLSADVGYQKDRIDGASGFGSGLKITEGVSMPNAIDPGMPTAQSWERSEYEDEYAALHGEFDITPEITLYAGAGGRNNTPYNLRTNHTLVDEGILASFPVYYPEYSDTRTVMSGLRSRFTTGAITHQLNLQASMLRYEGGYLYEAGENSLSSLNNIGNIKRPDFALSHNMPKTLERRLSSIAVSDTAGFIDDQVLLTLGVRHQRVEVDNFSAETGLQTASYDEGRITPAIGIAVRPWQNVTFYGNYIEGLGLGFTAPANAQNAGEAFEPERTQQAEAGIKIDFGQFGSSLSVFEIRQPSVIQKPGSTLDSFVYAQDGEQRNRGVEWQFFGKLTPELRLLGGVTYLNPELTNTQDGINDGNQASGVSPWSASISADWDVSSLPGFSVNTRVLHNSSQYGSATNTLEMPGWTRVDLGASYQMQMYPIMLRANIENLFDKDYWESFSGSGGRLRLAEPRYFTLSATVDF